MQEEEPATGSAVMSRQAKDDFLRHYTVSDPRTHPKGYTEYKVTAQVRWDPAGEHYPFKQLRIRAVP